MSYRSSTARAAVLCALALAALPAGARAQAEADSAAPVVRSVGVEYEYVHFDGDVEPWQLASVYLRRRSSRGTLLGRVNLADRFGERGAQVEIDAYPTLARGAYAYLNAGYSNAGFYPTWRFGAELFGNAAGGWEASAGGRVMRFDSTSADLLTASIGKYLGNYWVSLRPYVDLAGGASASLTARRYFVDGDNYVGANVAYGDTPPEDATAQELSSLTSFYAGLQGSHGLRERLLGVWSGGYEREELAPGRLRRRVRAQVGLRFDW